MIVFKIKELLEKDSEIKSRYALQKVTNWNYRRVDAFYKNKVVKFTVDEINLFCKLFKCKISDVMEYRED